MSTEMAGFFESRPAAEVAADEFASRTFDRDAIQILDAGERAVGLVLEPEVAELFAAAAHHRGTVLLIDVPDDRVLIAGEILQTNGAVGVYRRGGGRWELLDADVAPYDRGQRSGLPTEPILYEGAVAGYESLVPAFHTYHLANGGGAPFELYEPAYRYGYEQAISERNLGREWNDVEVELQREWDQRHPGSWAQFNPAVRHAWEEGRRR